MKVWTRLSLVLLALVLVGAGGYLGYDYLTSEKDKRDLDELAQHVAQVLERQASERQNSGSDGADVASQQRPQRIVNAKVELLPVETPSGQAGTEQRTTDANGIPLPIAETVALAAEKPELGGKPQGIDGDGLVRWVEDRIAENASFANPAIEMMRLRIDPPEGAAAPKVSVKLSGEFLKANPNLTEMEEQLSDWLKAQGYAEKSLQILDLKVHIDMPVLPQYADLFAENRDMIGWIQIEKTMVNYPVMQTPLDPEFYLRANFKREYAYSGLPFMDARNDPYDTTQNLIVYGHNMKSGTMFGTLSSYESEGYWEKHPTIKLDLLTEQREYEVFGAFHSKDYTKGKDVNEIGFRYYDYIDLKDLKLFTEYVDGVKEVSFYDTQIEPNWGEQLLTLSTCSYHTDHGMFVVVARRVG